MQRGSDRLSVHRDDEMKHELQGLLRSGHPTRAEEWYDPEPGADDDPGAVPDAGSVRFELGRHLGRRPFPAKRSELIRSLTAQHAPDPLIDLVRELPDDSRRYRNVQEVVTALGRGPA